jgi:hypothetical protein
MGVYDNRCTITGVSLLPSDAALVLLEPNDGTCRPISLAVKGYSDRMGSIDFIKKREPNASLLLKFFLGKLKTGDFIVDEEFLRICDRWPIDTLEIVLRNFERNMTDGHNNQLDGRRVEFSLICLPVWDAIAKATSPSKKSDASLFSELFTGSQIAQEIYGTKLAKVSPQLREMASVNKFLTTRKLSWRPSISDGGQHLGEEMLQYLNAARHEFKDSPSILAGLND